MSWLLAALGLVILLLAGDALVKGAVNLSLRVGIPAIIVSLTIVAFGTSAPELLIAVSAVAEHAPGIALGNVVGSNTANILLVLGIPALIAPLHTSKCDTRKNYLFMLSGSILFIALAMGGLIGPVQGLVLLAALAFVLWMSFQDVRTHRKSLAGVVSEDTGEELEGADPEMSWAMIGFYLVLGLIGLPLGAEILVESAIDIARTFGVSETVIGLTLVAVGTSLPELATTVMATVRRQAEVAMGNVIGSNMFNLLAIMGIASFVGPIPVSKEFLTFDLWIMLGSSLLLIPFVFKAWDLTRKWGLLFCGLYAAYVLVLIGQAVP